LYGDHSLMARIGFGVGLGCGGSVGEVWGFEAKTVGFEEDLSLPGVTYLEGFRGW
jgi:hypothetical protein